MVTSDQIVRTSTAPTLPVIEIFHSVQGEGTRVGEPAMFLRLAGCNLRCSWCDTTYSWSAEGLRDARKLELEAIRAEMRGQALVITGGEPMLHAARLVELLQFAREMESGGGTPAASHVTVETNGTIWPGDLVELVDLWSVSPKLPGSGQPCDVDVVAEFSRLSVDHVQLKFVIAELALDWAAMWDLLDAARVPEGVPVIVQPNGLRDDYDVALRELTEFVLADTRRASRVRVIPQTHRIAWGALARGV